MAAIRVLVVDDVPELRMLFRLMLEADSRFEVIGEAGDGEEAVAMARELAPDVIILDVAMPKLDGLSAIPLLHEASPGIRIMVLSGFDTHRVAEKAVASCATAFLSKGEPPDAILSLLHDVYLSPPKKLCAVA